MYNHETNKERELGKKDWKRLGDMGTTPEVTRGSSAGSSNKNNIYIYIYTINPENFMSKLGFEPQISGFTHWRLKQLVHRDTYTNSETNLSLIHISIQDSQNVILYYNSY